MMVVVLAASFVLLPRDIAQSQPRPGQGQIDSLGKFLRDYLKEPVYGDDMTTRYSSAWVDLGDDGTQEVIVYVIGRNWCGSGGCIMLVLEPKRTSFSVVTKTTITRLPIRVLATKLNGWHDISVRVQGGGVEPGYEARLSFDGKTYPSNPSVLPAQRVVGKIEGEVVVPLSAEGTPLYH
jgi:hypothetical protein